MRSNSFRYLGAGRSAGEVIRPALYHAMILGLILGHEESHAPVTISQFWGVVGAVKPYSRPAWIVFRGGTVGPTVGSNTVSTCSFVLYASIKQAKQSLKHVISK
jgi:hypothetical protein